MNKPITSQKLFARASKILPGGVDSPESYWNLLSSGRDALVDIPRERWQVEKFVVQDQRGVDQIEHSWDRIVPGPEHPRQLRDVIRRARQCGIPVGDARFFGGSGRT